MLAVNGPMVAEIGMNREREALGLFNHSHSSIGRCLAPDFQEPAGSGKPGETHRGFLRNPINDNNLCMPEKEEALYRLKAVGSGSIVPGRMLGYPVQTFHREQTDDANLFSRSRMCGAYIKPAQNSSAGIFHAPPSSLFSGS
jgi:hypothetical protein